MKKFLAIIILCCILFSALTACKTENEPEIETSTTNNTTDVETTTEQTQAATEFETEASTGTIDENGIIKIKNEKHSFTFEKTDFEKNYSEEFLMKVSNLIPMEYGVEDYDNWNGTPNEILNDAFFSSSVWYIDDYEYQSDKWNAAVAEMNKSLYAENLGEYSFTDIKKINSYLRSIYGPNVRQFKESDFEKYDEVKTSNESVFENYDFNFRYAYLPETGCIVRFANEICFSGGEATYVCDVKTVGETYIVKAVTGSEDLGQNGFTFEGRQDDALKMFNTYTYGKITGYIFNIGSDESGNLYMKSVEKSYILPENGGMTYKVTADNVKVEAKEYYSSDWKIIDTLSLGDEFYSSDYYYEEGYVRIDKAEYTGRVEAKYVTKIQ